MTRVDLLIPPLSNFDYLPLIRPNLFFFSKKGDLETYPISIFQRRRGKIYWQGFIFAFFYETGTEKRLRLSYPISFSQQNKKKIYQLLLKEIYELATSGDASKIDIIAFKEISGDIFFPTNFDALCSWNETDLFSILLERGFRERRKIIGYEIDINEMLSASESNVFSYVKNFNERLEVIRRIKGEKDLDLTHPPSIGERVLLKKEYLLISSNLVVYWLPDFYPYLTKYKIFPPISLPYHKQVQRAKVITCHPPLASLPFHLASTLLSSLMSMLKKMGIRRFQIEILANQQNYYKKLFAEYQPKIKYIKSFLELIVR